MKNYDKILSRDKALKDEVKALVESGVNLPIARRNGISNSAVAAAMVGPRNELPKAEAMIQLHLRPALLIKNNKIVSPDSAEIRKRIAPFIGKIESRIPSVGRIEILKIGREYGGTGWMISENILVTNRHVASLMAGFKGKKLVFLKNAIGDTVQAVVDFKEEYVGKNIARAELEIGIEEVMLMTHNKTSEPDIAFVRLKKHNKLPPPIPLTDTQLKKDQAISVIGYPGFDPGGFISTSAANEVFNNIYGVKRWSPGEVTEYEKSGWYFLHDCTTLGGNSGSVIIDTETGFAAGLHFMGEVEEANYAVKASHVVKYLKKINGNFFVGSTKKPKKESGPALEAAPKSYDDREGYDKLFLGKKFPVAMPSVVRNKTNVLKFKEAGKEEFELRYHHFSVVMNKARRMCFFSICNIDGELSKRGVKRSGWKLDGRIPKKLQIIEECYGDPPRFSRGHMTRKEDPIWGELEMARNAAADTFHVTNATPQMQPFNAPVWLALEDYALENARQDNMKITVITGPIFQSDDPVKFKVQIPVEFFKIIAFIHDDTGKLCATGYTVSQVDSLRNEEFIFGEFKTYQVSISSIEKRTGLKFGKLSAVDPIKGLEGMTGVLNKVEDVKFV
jgi:endonuclease G, mitochondrial